MINGTVDPRFAGVREVFARGFAEGLEQGSAVAVVADGKVVVDLWGGYADAAARRPWQADTLVNVWSVTKGVVAVAAAIEVERGRLRYDQPIAAVWPEFAANGKETITLDLVMSHRAGLNGLRVPLDRAALLASQPYTDALAAMAPLYPPGSVCAYHALSYGHLVAEPIRRVSGLSIGRHIAETIAGPLDVPFFVGLSEREEPRVAVMREGPHASDWLTQVAASPHPEAASNPTPVATDPNLREWRAAEVPGGNGHATARALAHIFGALVDGRGRLLGEAARDEAIRPRFVGTDASFNLPTAYAAGLRVIDPEFGARASQRTFGHSGWGGAIAFADPDARIGFAYVTNWMLGFDAGDPRRQRLVEAVYDGLGA